MSLEATTTLTHTDCSRSLVFAEREQLLVYLSGLPRLEGQALF